MLYWCASFYSIPNFPQDTVYADSFHLNAAPNLQEVQDALVAVIAKRISKAFQEHVSSSEDDDLFAIHQTFPPGGLARVKTVKAWAKAGQREDRTEKHS